MDRNTYDHAYSRFCLLLIEARKAAQLTQVDVALKLKKPQSFVSKYELGVRRLDFVEFLEIAKILEIDMLSFIGNLETRKSAP